MPRCLIGLGANLGHPRQQLDAAVEWLSRETRVLAVSQYLATKPIGGPAEQDPFLNATVAVETDQTPLELWQIFRQIEQSLGRQRGVRWEARTIDLDLLLYDDLIWKSTELTVPHPWMVVRRFVLQPAAEIVPDWIHPILGWTMARLWHHAQNAVPRFVLAGGWDLELGAEVSQRAGARWIPLASDEPASVDGRDWLERSVQQLVDAGWNSLDPQPMVSGFWWEEGRLDDRLAERAADLGLMLQTPKLVLIAAESGESDESAVANPLLSHAAQILRLVVEQQRTIGVIQPSADREDLLREAAGAITAIEGG